MSASKKRIVFQPPDRNTPGYFRRQRTMIGLQERLSTEQSVEAFDALIDELAKYVTDPSDPKEARELLMDLSEAELDGLQEAVKGNTSVPLGRNSSSGNGLPVARGRSRPGRSS